MDKGVQAGEGCVEGSTAPCQAGRVSQRTISRITVETLRRTLELSLVRPDALNLPWHLYNLYAREFEELCTLKMSGSLFSPMSPTPGGLLGPKVNKNAPPKASRIHSPEPLNRPAARGV